MSASGLLDSVKSAVTDRAISPLFGSFALSWGLWNYRFLLALFSELELNEKLKFIDSVLFKNPEDCLLRGILYPLLTTGFVIFVYPYPAKWTFQFWRARQRELRMIRQKIDEETPLTIEESRELRKQMAEQRLDHEKQLRQKDEDNAVLKEKVKNLSPILNLPPATKPAYADLPDECVQILRLLAENDGRMYEHEINEKIQKPSVFVKSHLDTLRRLNLITTASNTYSGVLLELTEIGREAAVKLNLIK
jgi:hypothetical protein